MLAFKDLRVLCQKLFSVTLVHLFVHLMFCYSSSPQTALHVPGEHPGCDRRPPHGVLHHLLLLRDGDCGSSGHWPVLRSVHRADSHVRGGGVTNTSSWSIWYSASARSGSGHPDCSGSKLYSLPNTQVLIINDLPLFIF